MAVSVLFHAASFICCMWFLACVDALYAVNRKGRWFYVHAIGNVVVTLSCVGDAWRAVSDPVHSMDADSSYSMLPIYMIGAIHAYHLVAFERVSSEDFWHHVIFAGTIVPGGLLSHWGPLQGLMAFFICGLPGGLDYWLLAKVKNGEIGKVQEKKYNTILNVWIRAPGCIITAFTMYVACRYGSPAAPWYGACLVALLCAVNGLYYMQRVCNNLGLHGEVAS